MKKQMVGLVMAVALLLPGLSASATEWQETPNLSQEMVELDEVEVTQSMEMAEDEVTALEMTSVTGGASMEQASKINVGKEYLSRTGSQEGNVWYKFTTSSQGTWHTVTFKNLRSNGWMNIQIYNSIGERLVNRDVWENQTYSSSHRLKSNTQYYLKIWNGHGQAGNYSMSVNQLEDGVQDVKEQALPIQERGVYTTELCSDGDVDWYVIRPSYQGKYAIDIQGLSGGVNLEIYTEYDEKLGSKTVGSNSNNSILLHLDAGQVYYLKVSKDWWDIGNYRFCVSNYFPYTDIPQQMGYWKYDSAKFVSDREIMQGISGTSSFQPDAQLTRGMFVTILYRMAGEPYYSSSAKFSDVSYGAYYYNAVRWAYSNNIVSGYSDGRFGVNDPITREQIAKMLYQFGYSQGHNVNERANINSFTDLYAVNGWGVEYFRWAVAAKMISGKANGNGTYRLDPQGYATRAECAKMIQVFLQKYT
ncbi:MAG: S-layer homology domain-containing protein [Lachnospiraceae bacterium]|nr:S-layer homology domain-containing protein [Lachnospiraceae bacterium]